MSKSYNPQTWDTNSDFTPSRMNHIEQGIEDVDLTGGGTVHNDLRIVKDNTGTTCYDSRQYLGNDTPEGSIGCARGVLSIYDRNQYSATLLAGDDVPLTANRYLKLPDKTGRLATTDDIQSSYPIERIKAQTESASFTFQLLSNTIYIVTMGTASGNGSLIYDVSAFVVWRPINGGSNIESRLLFGTSRTVTFSMSGDNCTASVSGQARWGAFKLLTFL